MGSHPRLLGPSMLLLAGAVLAGASWAATEALDSRQIRTPLVAPEDILARDLTAVDLTVLFDRRVQTPLEVHRADPEGGSLQDEHAWRVVVYFDAPLSTPDGLRQAALLLSREAETLTHLGPTEIVLADPQPYRYLAGSRDALALKDALRDIRSQTPVTAGELVWHRQRFSAQLEGGRQPGFARPERRDGADRTTAPEPASLAGRHRPCRARASHPGAKRL